MKHYKNLFINQLNTKDIGHFTTDTGLFQKHKRCQAAMWST